jgi:hypothetical protein
VAIRDPYLGRVFIIRYSPSAAQTPSGTRPTDERPKFNQEAIEARRAPSEELKARREAYGEALAARKSALKARIKAIREARSER